MSADEKKAKRRDRNKTKRIEKARKLLEATEKPESYKNEKSWKAAITKAKKLLASI